MHVGKDMRTQDGWSSSGSRFTASPSLEANRDGCSLPRVLGERCLHRVLLRCVSRAARVCVASGVRIEQ